MPNQTSFLNQQFYYVAKIEGDSLTIVRVTSMPTSASPKVRQQFEYTELDIATSQFVQQQTSEIRLHMRRTVESIFEVGQRLIAVKARLGHGRYGLWLTTEFDWSQDTADNFIHVAERLGQNPKFSDFNMAASALYVLFAPSIPEAAREEAVARSRAGEFITHKSALAIKQKYAQTPKKLKPEPEPKHEPKSGQKPELQPVSQSQPSTIPVPLPQSGSKLEIVAFRPQAQAQTIPQVSRIIANQTGQTLASQSNSTGSAPEAPGIWWQLGGKHLLFCGDPNSPEFLERIPKKLSLLFAFPSIPNWQPSMQASTRFILETLPEGKNTRLFEDTLESVLLLCSNIGDVVVSCFLPSLEILSIFNRLNRRSLLAEPDLRRCNELITDWKRAGVKVERVN